MSRWKQATNQKTRRRPVDNEAKDGYITSMYNKYVADELLGWGDEDA
jgi:hypothetical protein